MIFAAVIIFTANCESKNAKTKSETQYETLSETASQTKSHTSVSGISKDWLEIKTELNSIDMTKTGFLADQIKEFNLSLNSFINSPIGYLYRTHRRGEMHTVHDITAAINRLETSVQDGDGRDVSSIIMEIDRAVTTLQNVDAELSAASQLNFFLLFFFFSLLVIAITLTLTALRNRLGKEMSQHQQSMSFARETILAQEHERSRIARELHDTVAQDLLRLSLQTEIIKKDAVCEEQSRLCAKVAEGQTELLSRIRNICNNLIPPDFQPDDVNHSRLPAALQNLCHEFEKRTGIECNITIQDNADFSFLDGDMQLHCFRIVQECLANIEKHAAADEVSALVRSNAKGELLIFVSDNGKGFTASGDDLFRELREKGHFGLWNMRERAISMNGVLTLDSEAGEGATIKLKIPPAIFHGVTE